MTTRQAVLWYASAGAVGVVAASLADGVRGGVAAAVAWTLCSVAFVRPPRKPRVAAFSIAPKITSDRRFAIAAMPLRMMVVLVTAAILYSQLGDRLGLGFWFAVLGFYLIALTLSVARTLTDLKRAGQETLTR